MKLTLGSLFSALLVLALVAEAAAFGIHNKCTYSTRSLQLSSSNKDDDMSKPTPEQLGFAGTADRDASRRQDELNQQKVRVDLVEDVDPVDLTAVGFGLIAINFFILANLGDGGLAGFLATIINTMNQ